MNRISLLLLIAILPSCRPQPRAENDNGETVAAVRAVLDAQRSAWNRGDIDGFMDGYERSEKTTFVSGNEITFGWQTVLDRYKQRYASPQQMGTLTFSELQVTALADAFALADGQWQLARAGDEPHGRFTLVFHRTSAGWRIIHDTTTSATP